MLDYVLEWQQLCKALCVPLGMPNVVLLPNFSVFLGWEATGLWEGYRCEVHLVEPTRNRRRKAEVLGPGEVPREQQVQ